MPVCFLPAVAALLSPAADPAASGDAYAIKVVEDAAPPEDLHEPVRKLLGGRCVRLLDPKGELVAELWFCKELPARATEAQLQNGLTYQEVPEGSVLGAARVTGTLADYRRQPLPAGVYTLRLAHQPVSDDHNGTAPHPDFALACPAAEDAAAAPPATKALYTLSKKCTGKHPAVFLLFPGKPVDAPKLVDHGEGHWVLRWKQDVRTGTTKGTMHLALTLVGASPAAPGKEARQVGPP